MKDVLKRALIMEISMIKLLYVNIDTVKHLNFTSSYTCAASISFTGKNGFERSVPENRKSNVVYIANIPGRPTTHNHKHFKFNEGSTRQ
jgi:hypothetical protein